MYTTWKYLIPGSSSAAVEESQSARLAPEHCGQCRSPQELYTEHSLWHASQRYRRPPKAAVRHSDNFASVLCT